MPRRYSCTITAPAAWTVDTRLDGPMLLYCLCQIKKLSRARANYSLSFLILADRSETQYGSSAGLAHLLQGLII